MDLSGDWEDSSTSGLLQVSGQGSNVSIVWTRTSHFPDEKRALNMLRWPPDRDKVLKAQHLGDGEPVEDPADNFSPVTGQTRLNVEATEDWGCWPVPPETSCRVHYRIALTGEADDDRLTGEVQLWREGWVFLWANVRNVAGWDATFTRAAPLVLRDCSHPDAGPQTSGGGGGGCGGTLQERSDAGGWWSPSSSRGWWDSSSSSQWAGSTGSSAPSVASLSFSVASTSGASSISSSGASSASSAAPADGGLPDEDAATPTDAGPLLPLDDAGSLPDAGAPDSSLVPESDAGRPVPGDAGDGDAAG